MKKKIIIAILTALLGTYLALPKEILSSAIEKIYCELNKSDCLESENK